MILACYCVYHVFSHAFPKPLPGVGHACAMIRPCICHAFGRALPRLGHDVAEPRNGCALPLLWTLKRPGRSLATPLPRLACPAHKGCAKNGAPCCIVDPSDARSPASHRLLNYMAAELDSAASQRAWRTEACGHGSRSTRATCSSKQEQTHNKPSQQGKPK